MISPVTPLSRLGDEGSSANGAIATRRVWRTEARAMPLDAFRIAAGLALTWYVVELWQQAQPLFEAGFLSTALSHTFARHVVSSPVVSRLAYGAALLACGGVTLGVRPRWCAALLLVAQVSMRHALFQASHLDDYCATQLLFWLVLLPVGQTLRPTRAPRRDLPKWRALRVGGLAASFLACHVVALYLSVRIWGVYSPGWPASSWVTAAACLVPGLYLLPMGGLRWIGFGVQLALHGYLAVATGEWLTHSVLLASVFLLWGDPTLEAATSKPSTPTLDVAAVVAGLYSLVLLIWAAGVTFQVPRLYAASGRALADSGLALPLPPAITTGASFVFTSPRAEPEALADVDSLSALTTQRGRWALGRLLEASASDQPVVRGFAEAELTAVARRYCAGRAPSETRVTLALRWHGPGGEAQIAPVGSFDCYDPGHSAELAAR